MSVLTKNTFLLTIASVGQKAIAFFYFAFIANVLGDETLLGAYFLALVLTTTVGVLDDVGMTSVVIRDTAKNQNGAKELIKNILGWKLCIIPFTVFLACILPGALDFSAQATSLVYIAVFVMVADTLSVTLYGVLRGLHTVKYEAIGVFIGQSLTAIGGAIALTTQELDIRYLVFALLIGSTWNVLFAAIQVSRKLGADALIPSWSMGTRPLRLGAMFFLAAIFVKIYSYIDSFTIKMVLGEGALGVYSIAYKFAYAFQFLPLAFVGALYPAMSAQLHDKIALKKTFLQAEWYLALLGAPIIFGLAALAPEIINLVYGDRYLAAAPVLQLLLIGLWFIFMDFPIGSLLNASDMQRKKTFAMGIAMIMNFAANMIFVRMFGIAGAGYSAILTFITLFCAGFYFARQVIPLTVAEWWGSVRGVTLAGLCMFVVVFLIKAPLMSVHPLAWIFSIPIGALVFIFLGWQFGGITAYHIQSVTRNLRSKQYVEDSPTNA
ncbi:MAG: flippase [Patescibacteria group bacterium]